MNPATNVPLTLTLNDIEVLLALALKQTAIPGEVWLNTYFSLRNQRDAFVKDAAVNAIPKPPPAPTKRKGA